MQPTPGREPARNGVPGISEALDAVMATEARFVKACLPYPDMVRVPDHFERFAREHHQRILRAKYRWQDACPAYALALLTHAAYGGPLDESIEWELVLQWDELRGLSELDWPQARTVLVDAWTYLETAR